MSACLPPRTQQRGRVTLPAARMLCPRAWPPAGSRGRGQSRHLCIDESYSILLPSPFGSGVRVEAPPGSSRKPTALIPNDLVPFRLASGHRAKSAAKGKTDGHASRAAVLMRCQDSQTPGLPYHMPCDLHGWSPQALAGIVREAGIAIPFHGPFAPKPQAVAGCGRPRPHVTVRISRPPHDTLTAVADARA